MVQRFEERIPALVSSSIGLIMFRFLRQFRGFAPIVGWLYPRIETRDDSIQAWGDSGADRHLKIRTPHIDQLAREAMRLNRSMYASQ